MNLCAMWIITISNYLITPGTIFCTSMCRGVMLTLYLRPLRSLLKVMAINLGRQTKGEGYTVKAVCLLYKRLLKSSQSA